MKMLPMRFPFALLLAFGVASCGQGEVDGPEEEFEVTQEDQLARERAAVLFAEEDLPGSVKALSPLIERDDALGIDLLRMGIIHLTQEDVEGARKYLQAAGKKLKRSPSLAYNLGRIASRDGNFEACVEHFGRAHELAPDDTPSLFQLASAYATLGDDKAVGLFQELLDKGVENTNSWYLAALYRLGRFHLESGDAAASAEAMGDFNRLQATGLATMSSTDMDRGNYGTLEQPAPVGFAGAKEVTLALEPAETLSDLAGMTGFMVVDLIDDWVMPSADSKVVPTIGSTNLMAWGPTGVKAATPTASGSWLVSLLWPESVEVVQGLDFDQDGDLDLFIYGDGELALLRQDNGAFADAGVTMPASPGLVRDVRVVDQDHEGDLDLLLVGDFGARLWRADGAAQGGEFADISDISGVNHTGALQWCVTEDFDTDSDVDFLVGGDQGVVWYSNLRGSRFETLSAGFAQVADTVAPEVRDANADGRPDIRFADGKWWAGAAGARFVESDLSLPATATLADLDRDSVQDRLSLSADGVSFERGKDTGTGHMVLALRGTADNRRAVGAIVEYRAGPMYRRVYWRGEPQILDFGGQQTADWLKVTWTNGVTQFGVDIPNGENIILTQKEGLAGSCPFLYTWNGEKYEFISDVLGATPLGLPMAEGMYVPPDHDEYVLVLGEQLAPKDGFLDVQFTEELREVTYLDKIRLDVVDHPEGTELYPNEKFTFPPFPEAHNHFVEDPVLPSSARGSDGKDWTESLQAIDLNFAVPFDHYQGTLPSDEPGGGQFLGLAPHHSLEISFADDSIASADKLRLLFTGWFYWSVASVNMAASRTPGIDFVPPMLEVPDGEGGWRMVEPPIGFPAGKLKTMVIDVTDILVREDPRIRVSSTLRLYWDCIRLATDGDNTPNRITSLDPASADLWFRGFSKPVEMEQSSELLLEWFDWSELEPAPRWNQHPGLYTRLGDVLPLVQEAEDMFVVMGSGDALHVRFDASQLPELPDGWRRDYLVYLDGWAKDRDHSCADVEYTEPFPFHGMSGFPYGEDEHFPDDPEYLEWRLEWLTRPARFLLDEYTAEASSK